jgi:integrase/recombinase XerD
VDLDVRTVLEFLRHIEAERGCSALTRNARLAAVKSFFRYVAVHEPAALPIAQRVLAIPTKRFDRKLVGYLSPDEMKAVLAAPDLSTWSGRRDHAMLVTAYNTAARVSELVGMLRENVELAPALGTVKIHGKGRKERVAVLSRDATTVLRRWERELGESTRVLFPNRSGAAMTRSGARGRLLVTVRRAAATCPSLRQRQVSPHMIRHTTAMHLLQSGVNLASIALFLGHEDVQTTHGYVEADADMKRKTLAALPRLTRRRRRDPKQTDELIAFLESLQREHPSDGPP